MGYFRDLRTRLGLRKAKPTDRWPYPGIRIGRHTYGIVPESIHGYDATSVLDVGSFCSIAEEVLFFVRSNHPTNLPSTFPLEVYVSKTKRSKDDLVSKGPISIGNDVWIGRRAVIMSGITIGHGAIIGACSVVTRDVPPYAIAAGNPARVVGYRFPEPVIRQLLELQWWNWSDDKIRRNIDAFMRPAGEFIEAIAHRPPPGTPPT
ncbi:CatB-related O-acetyltransferase [Ferirhizobium litorale]|uniref:CatB-related O-acetyltransferase n=1 Tax=Ferirhizobium litorale TaxID=2927786 RepID=UPI0028937DBD|nr:CatB-related O-acetyltransferase [Fererhizobium litorale]